MDKKEYQRNYYQNNKDKYKEYSKRSYIKNYDKINEYKTLYYKQYRDKNRDEYNAYYRQYRLKKLNKEDVSLSEATNVKPILQKKIDTPKSIITVRHSSPNHPIFVYFE